MEKKTSPKFICDNCMKLNQLKFDPKFEYAKLRNTRCQFGNHNFVNEKQRQELMDEKIYAEAVQIDISNQ